MLGITVLLLALAPGLALADHTPNHGDPCREATPATFFADYNRARRVHRASIDCAFYRGITSGAGTNAAGQPVYRPRQEVTRAQMAQFIVNTLIAAGYDSRLPSGGQNQFDDIAGNFARVAINRLARAGIVSGTSARRYSPGASVTRQQMATYLVQAADFALNPDIAGDGRTRFVDVSAGNVHRANIENGADAGLFQGTSATTFSPGRTVVRDQMATFLVNLLRYVFDGANAPVPFTATARVDDTNVRAGSPVTGEVVGSNIRSATISGCGIATQPLTDRDEVRTGIQYSVQIPSTQPQGTCTLTFAVTFTSGNERSSTIQLNVLAGNQATLTLNQTAVQPGGQFSGQITGTNVASARVSGCGLTNEPAEDRNANQAGIQFTETVPASQPMGNCTLTFTVTFVDNRTETLTAQLTVGAQPGATTRPELIQAAIVSTTTTAQATSGNPAGTVVRYFFDEPVSAPSASRFFVYRADAGRVAAESAAPQVESGGVSVLVRFPTVNTPALAAELTTATVDDGAVTDAQGQSNPEGAAALPAPASNPAGITAAPDLVTVGPLRPGLQSGTTAVDFRFDETTYTVTPSGFHLVLTNNSVVQCTGPARDSSTAGGQTVAGGNGSTRLTVICDNPGGTALTANNVARGYLDAGTVSDVQQPGGGGAVQGNVNPLQAELVGSGGATSGPDLQGVVVAPGATPTAPDIAVFSFDTTVDTAVVANRFVVYDVTGREFTGVSAERQSGGGQNRRRVSVTFAADAFDAIAGASVRDGAVTDGSSPARPEEVGIAGPAPAGTPGITAAPDLVSVALATSGSGASAVTTATFTFDETLNVAGGASQPSRFHLYLADGTELVCAGVAGSTFTVSQRTASCSRFTVAGANATAAQIASAVLGTVDHGAVDDADAGTQLNPEGAKRTTGGTGTPAQ